MHSNPDRIRWNKKYADRGPENFGLSPSPWLVQHEFLLKALNGGKALDIACGNGRNSLFLAELGFSVDAIDISDVAIEWLETQAAARQLPIDTYCIDLGKSPFPNPEYQVIICFNFLGRALFSHIKKALTHGGLLIFETMYRDEIEVLGSGINPDYVLDHNELLRVFGDMRIIAYREQIITVGNRGKRKALSGLVARRV